MSLALEKQRLLSNAIEQSQELAGKIGLDTLALNTPIVAPAPDIEPKTPVRASGIMFVCGSKMLLIKRGADCPSPGCWAFPGGKIEDGETEEEAAVRECREEIGNCPDGKRYVFSRRISDGVDFTTFIQRLDEEFIPALNDESCGYCWAAADDIPAPIHPGAVVTIRKLNMNEGDIAQAIADGELVSPQQFHNIWLFALRITGTGTAFRDKLNEYVYRAPENYLTPEFLARCNGLPIIIDHPVEKTLNSEQFQERIIGTITLPYIRGEEVWGIAKIYDQSAAEMMRERQLSTSPTVAGVTGADSVKVDLNDGSTLLIEGKPRLLDHLAICLAGVWDKGGEPRGVESVMADEKDEKKADNEEKKSEENMSNKSDNKENMKDDSKSDSDDKFDRLMSAVDSLSKRMDSYDKKEDKKADASEEKVEEMKKASDKKSDSEDNGNKEENEDGSKKDGRKDSKKDSDEKKSEEDRADSATIRELRSMVENLSKQVKSRDVSQEEENAMADAQARCDAVAQAFGEHAPRSMSGENLLDYRRRLARKYQKNSSDWKEVNLAELSGRAFDVAESRIYADSMAEAMHPRSAGNGLREIKKADRTGRMVSTFVGNPNEWMSDFAHRGFRVTGFNDARAK